MGKFIDLTNQKFNKLTVIERDNSRNNRAYYFCQCECGNIKSISAGNLKSGSSTSCGKCPVNTWEIKDEYVIGKTRKDETFLIDLDDFKEVSKYTWCIHNKGYVINNKIGFLHRFIMKPDYNEDVDHINHDKTDNRRKNLRVCNRSENQMNKKAKGYYFNKRSKKYIAYIIKDYKRIHLGYYNTEEAARKVYVLKAIEIFGEYAHETVKQEYEKMEVK